MAFDVKKEYKDLYQPAATPSIIEVPRMRFVAVEGSGDPNEEDDDYQTALQLLYGVSFTIKMSRVQGSGRAHRGLLRLRGAAAGGPVAHGHE